jgi:hypothetical protein
MSLRRKLIANIVIVMKSKIKSKHKQIGRPKGSGKYGVPTRVIRVPENLTLKIEEFIKDQLGTKGPFISTEQAINIYRCAKALLSRAEAVNMIKVSVEAKRLNRALDSVEYPLFVTGKE